MPYRVAADDGVGIWSYAIQAPRSPKEDPKLVRSENGTIYKCQAAANSLLYRFAQLDPSVSLRLEIIPPVRRKP